ncbi:SMI1/KNR4 family protein [Stenotrophomonas maltophilia]|uniref:SMI1/KNR4 family protein n=1 Tax=Stenotrophomonas maltophilia TaxID=40324 RepID=UPI0021ABCA58|nr:SMI1/KNR4 family protein [Stenotrophomonas maltophilia]
MSALSGIEQATGQTFPPLFKQLHAAGRLSWGATHPEWSEVVFPALQAEPPVLLYAQDYEPLEHDELLEAWQELTAEDHYNPLRTDLQLLPFARTGGGDSYCFWSNAPGFAESPVVLVWHDDDRADVLAASYQDFLFRKMVEAVADYQGRTRCCRTASWPATCGAGCRATSRSCAMTSTQPCSGCSPALTISLKETSATRMHRPSSLK